MWRAVTCLTASGLFAGTALAQESGTVEREGVMSYAERIDRTLSAAPGTTLYLVSSRGSVQVESWDQDEIQVVVTKKARALTEDRARELFADFQVHIDTEDEEVRVQASSQGDQQGDSLELVFEFRVPKVCNLELKTSGGSISIGDLEGRVRARTSGGSIEVGYLKNGPAEIETTNGSIDIGGIENGDARARTTGGSIDIGRVAGHVDAQTSGGSITVERAGGTVRARTTGGSIEVSGAGGQVWAETSGGSIEIGQTQGAVEASTSGGSIQLEGAGGPVRAHTLGGSIQISAARGFIEAETSGGSIEAELAVTDPSADAHCTLKAAGGDLILYLPADLPATITAELHIDHQDERNYRIYSAFPLTIQGEGTETISGRGQINEGGNPINLSTVNGDIHLEKRED